MATLRLKHIVLFVEDIAKETAYYRDVLGLPIVEDRDGWVAFEISEGVVLALHRGKGRKPRLDFVSDAGLTATRDALNARGAKMSEVIAVGPLMITEGRDPEGNLHRILERPAPDNDLLGSVAPGIPPSI